MHYEMRARKKLCNGFSPRADIIVIDANMETGSLLSTVRITEVCSQVVCSQVVCFKIIHKVVK
jgi:hypothetical protein